MLFLLAFVFSLDLDNENKIYGTGVDDDDEISGSGQNESGGDSFDFHDTGYKESLISRDQAQHKPTGRERSGRLRKKHSRPAGGGAGILLLLVVAGFVLSVVSIAFLGR